MAEDKKAKEEVKKEKVKRKKEIPKVDSEKAHFASVNVKNLPISIKQSVEIARYLRGRGLAQSKAFLQDVIDKKRAVPFKRYNRDVGHKPGKIAAGRYPEKASGHFLLLLNSLEANAENKGLDVDTLIISEVIANKGPDQWHYGRLRRRKMKKTHLQIKAVEKEK
jgi:large subunit ribosomal protein L22